MTNRARPYAPLVCFDDAEEEQEQTRVFSRQAFDVEQERKVPAHRFVAIGIPAFFPDDEVVATQSTAWIRAAAAMFWGCALSIIGAAAFIALAER